MFISGITCTKLKRPKNHFSVLLWNESWFCFWCVFWLRRRCFFMGTFSASQQETSLEQHTHRELMRCNYQKKSTNCNYLNNMYDNINILLYPGCLYWLILWLFVMIKIIWKYIDLFPVYTWKRFGLCQIKVQYEFAISLHVFDPCQAQKKILRLLLLNVHLNVQVDQLLWLLWN